ncbi:MAG: intracellular septation protein [Variibacter sp.]|nr:intracellular septation protein [Variibacter sp.]
MTPTPKKQLSPGLKLALDLGPLVVFFVANAKLGIFAGTGAFMAAVLVTTIVSYALTRHLPVMAIVSFVVVAVFGGLTLVLHDETFIKVKPTIIYLLFGGVLLGGLAMRKPLLATVFDSAFDLDDAGWRKLSLRWAGFFIGMAILNEIIWRTQSTDAWVNFKVFGAIPLTFAFAMLQLPLLKKHARAERPSQSDDVKRDAA